MNKEQLLKHIEEFVKERVKLYDGGHDWWHIERVRRTALYIQLCEGTGDRFIVELASLMHDIGDKKFRKDSDSSAEATISSFLKDLGVDDELIERVIFINKHISFSSPVQLSEKQVEMMIVQDADRLDAIGAIGIARAFNYGGFINNPVFDPHGNRKSTITHFYDKLLKLKGLMNTETGSRLAVERHEFLTLFLKQFYKEWNFDYAS